MLRALLRGAGAGGRRFYRVPPSSSSPRPRAGGCRCGSEAGARRPGSPGSPGSPTAGSPPPTTPRPSASRPAATRWRARAGRDPTGSPTRSRRCGRGWRGSRRGRRVLADVLAPLLGAIRRSCARRSASARPSTARSCSRATRRRAASASPVAAGRRAAPARAGRERGCAEHLEAWPWARRRIRIYRRARGALILSWRARAGRHRRHRRGAVGHERPDPRTSAREAMRACLLATELARRAGLDDPDRCDVHYAALLRFAG